MSSESPKILIVGSGPTGLILALSLSRNGVPVRVIEKSRVSRLGQRGSGTMPRSLELYESLGIVDEVNKRSMELPMFRIYKMPGGTEILKEFEGIERDIPPTPSCPYINIRSLGQNNLDKILRAELQKAGCEVELGVELQSLKQDDDRVDVTLLKHGVDGSTTTEETSYSWVVGADGAKGSVRRQLGMRLVGETSGQSFVIGDLTLEGLSTDRWHLWGEMANVMVSIRPTEDAGVFNFIIGGTNLEGVDELASNKEKLVEFFRIHTGGREDIKYGKFLYLSPYRVNLRMAETFKQGRVFLAGDAAHVHSPAGGQGMNTGIQDSFNLGWKLALVAKGLSPASLLDSFNEERVPVVSEMLNITNALFQKTLNATSSEDGWERKGSIKQLGVNYRWSSIVVDEENEKARGEGSIRGSAYDIGIGGVVQAGDRAPDAPSLVRIQSADSVAHGSPTSVFKMLSPRRHTVLLFADRINTKAVLPLLAKYSPDLVFVAVIVKAGQGSAVADLHKNTNVFEDRDGHAYEAYRGAEGTSGIYAIRPDRVVGARVGTGEGLTRYFQNIFA